MPRLRLLKVSQREREGGREGGRERGREGGREGGREKEGGGRGREGERERGVNVLHILRRSLHTSEGASYEDVEAQKDLHWPP